jgi:hypothetical protein
MGTYNGSPIKWRVLDDKTNTGAPGLFLLSDTLLETGVIFKSSAPYSNAWQNSDAQGWCGAFAANRLTENELAAVLATTKSDAAFTSSLHKVLFYAAESILAGDKVFFLSAEEAENSAYGFTNDGARKANYDGSNMQWWLRSPDGGAGFVDTDGTVKDYSVNYGRAARPAFNLDMDSVLFTSAAAGGKSSGAAGSAALRSNLVPAGTKEWKLTLYDNSRNFTISDISKSGDTVSFNYSGATVGADEYISAIIKDSGGNITCYGRIAQPSAASGAAEVDLSGVAVDADDTLYIFSEQYNGGADDDTKLTDYASELMEISLGAPVSPTVTTTALPGGTVDTAYSRTLAATGTAPITWSMADGSNPLPDGLALSAGGVISGTPTAAGTFNFTVEATNAMGSDTQALSIIISPKPVAPAIITTALPGGMMDTAYSQTLAATGTAPITWRVESGSLPGWLTLSYDGIISGMPITTGTFTFTVKATNAAGSDTKELSISLAPSPAAPTITGAGYDAVTGVLKVTGTLFARYYGGAADVDVTKLTVTGESGETHTLTNDTADVGVTDYFSFSVTLGATDKAAVDALLNQSGTASVDGTAYYLEAAEGWLRGATVRAGAAGPITVSPKLEITNAHELNAVRDSPAQSYELMNDINLGGAVWEPIATFAGTFNGNGHTVSNFSINKDSSDNVGFFGTISAGGAVKDLTLQNVAVTGRSQTGGLAGTNQGTITNCGVTGSVTGNDGYDYIGGLVAANGGVITKSYATANVSRVRWYAGGLVGANAGSITLSYATGNVRDADTCAGGLVGQNRGGSIENCYATGRVTGTSAVGGLTGDNYLASATIVNSYAAGLATGTSTTGGLAGQNNQGGPITSSYYGQTTGQSDTGKGIRKATADMRQRATFVGWDFDTVWTIGEGTSYPHLRCNIPSNSVPVRQSGIAETAAASVAVNMTYNLDLSTLFEDADGNPLAYLVSVDGAGDIAADESYSYTPTVVGDTILVFKASDGMADSIDTYTLSISAAHVSPAITGADYDADAGVLRVAGTHFTGFTGDDNDIDVTKLSVTGEGGAAYTLTNATADVEITDAGSFTAALGAADKAAVNALLNQAGTISIGGTAYNLAAAEGWVRGAADTADAASPITVAPRLQITNAHELNAVRDNPSLSYKLMNGIDLGGAVWEPIAEFPGTFNGNGYTISNFSVNKGDADYVGFFGSVALGGAVKNLTLQNAAVTGRDFTGGLAGTNYGAITNCRVTGSVTGNDGHNYVGGLVGFNAGEIRESRATANVCHANWYVGGLVGANIGSITLSCATGNVQNASTCVGGLVGQNRGGSIGNCYATGKATGALAVGGLVGDNYLLSARIVNSYAAGLVTGTTAPGGLAGQNNQYGPITSSYYDQAATGQSDTDKGTGKTTIEMRQRATFVGWDFDTVWTIDEGTSYPYLRWSISSNAAPVRKAAVAATATASVMVNTSYTIDLATIFEDTDGDPLTYLISVDGADDIAADKSYSYTPTAAGDTILVFKANDGTADSTDTYTVTLTATAAPIAPTITTPTLTGGTVGVAYSQTLAATGDTPITWSMADGSDPLPDGMTLSAGGTVSGTPTKAGTFNFTVKATNAAGDDTQALSIVISAAPIAPTVTTTTLPGGTVGVAYSQTLAATGDTPITWSMADGSDPLPGGLTLSTGGVISGTPTEAGTFTFTVEATNAAGSDTQELSISAVPAAPAITGADYDAGTGVLTVTGTHFTEFAGDDNDINVTRLTITGEGGAEAAYTLTNDTADVEITNAGSFTATLGAADKTAVDVLLNQSGTVSADGTAYNLAAAEGWARGAAGIADATSPITVAPRLQITNAHELNAVRDNPAGSYKLMNDINLSGAVWKPIANFSGTFNGNGYTISNFSTNKSDTDYVGFFGSIAPGGTVKNLTLQNVAVTGRAQTGGLAGTNINGTITNCGVTGSVTGNDGYDYVGGLVGFNAGVITKSYATATVSHVFWHAGGLVGANTGSITLSYATGNVQNASTCVGGLVGQNRGGSIENCYATGAVTGTWAVGGLAGDNYGAPASIVNSYAAGLVTGTTNPGGLAGQNNQSGPITSSYYDQTTGQSDTGKGTGKTTAEMRQKTTFVGWDFDTVWTIHEGISYPHLRWSIPGNTVPVRKSGIAETAAASVTVNTAYTLDLSTIFEDADADDTLTYKVSVDGAEDVAAAESYSYTPTSTGTTTLVFKANDGTADSTDTYTVTLTANAAPAATLEGIAITTPATRLVYTVGESLDISGMVVMGTYSDSSTKAETITTANVTGFDSSAPAEDQVLTVTVGGKTATYTVTINAAPAATLEGIAITTPATRLVYTVGESLDITGLVVTGTYSDSSTKAETITAANVSGFDSSAPAVDQVLTVTVGAKTTTYTVTINAAPAATLQSIAITTPASKLVYTVGESLDISGMVVTGTYSDSSTKTETITAANVNGFDSSAPAVDQVLTVTVGGKTATYTVTINAAPAATYSLTITAGTGGSIAAGSSGNYAAGTAIPIAASADANYSFNKWTAAGGGSFANANSTSTTFTMPPGAVTITAEFTYSGGGGNNGGGGRGSAPPSPTYYARIEGGGRIPVTVNTGTGDAAVNLGTVAGSMAGSGSTTIVVPDIPGVNACTANLPAAALIGPGAGSLTLGTGLGNITIPGNMLSGTGLTGEVGITIGESSKENLSDEVKEVLGSRPVIRLTLSIDGKQTDWNNPSAPVTVSIPYAPTAAELANPEHIVVWYIDGSGNAVSVPDGRYDPATGTVTFSTTHFSRYAVAYVHKTFSDLGTAEWARKPIEVMASKGITNGTGDGTAFSPSANITRADFMALLINTLGLTADFTDNFADVKPGAYYYEAVGAAKELGIAAGTGNNKFNPAESISRQDMMVLAARALEKYQGLKTTSALTVLDKFSDKGGIAGYAVESTAALVREGLIAGYGDKLNPLASTARAEAAVILYRIYSKYPGTLPGQ